MKKLEEDEMKSQRKKKLSVVQEAEVVKDIIHVLLDRSWPDRVVHDLKIPYHEIGIEDYGKW